jgi:hypothetical protein
MSADMHAAAPIGRRIAVLGVGAVGTRLARQLVSTDDVREVAIRNGSRERAEIVVQSLGPKAVIDPGGYLDEIEADVVVLATPAREHRVATETFLRRGQHVVSVADSVPAVRALLGLDTEARERGVHVVVGAGFAPGLSCVLAKHAASWFDVVDEIHVAKAGTGGPACARQHHRALREMAVDWRDGTWTQRPGGSGRELCWFPDPVGARDCYRAAVPDALLLTPAFRSVQRVTSRVAANRKDRFTSQLPMLWPTHPEGGPGAIRVEVRGRRGAATDAVVLGVMDRPAVAAGAVAAVAGLWAADGKLERAGAAGLADLVEPLPFLAELHERGVRAAVFEGALSTPA